MDHTKRPRPNFEIPVAFGAYGDCQRPKTGPDLVDRDSGMDVLVGVNADDDFDRVGLAHVEGSPEVRTRRCPASGQDCDGTGSLKLLLSHVSADRQAHLENRQVNAMTRGQSQQGSGPPSAPTLSQPSNGPANNDSALPVAQAGPGSSLAGAYLNQFNEMV